MAGLFAQLGNAAATGQLATDVIAGELGSAIGLPWSVCVCQSSAPDVWQAKSELTIVLPTFALMPVWHLATTFIDDDEVPQQSATVNMRVYVPGNCGLKVILSLHKSLALLSTVSTGSMYPRLSEVFVQGVSERAHEQFSGHLVHVAAGTTTVVATGTVISVGSVHDREIKRHRVDSVLHVPLTLPTKLKILFPKLFIFAAAFAPPIHLISSGVALPATLELALAIAKVEAHWTVNKEVVDAGGLQPSSAVNWTMYTPARSGTNDADGICPFVIDS